MSEQYEKYDLMIGREDTRSPLRRHLEGLIAEATHAGWSDADLLEELKLAIMKPEVQAETEKALRLEPGGIYVIEVDARLTTEQSERLGKQVSAEGERLGVRFMILGKGCRIAKEAA